MNVVTTDAELALLTRIAQLQRTGTGWFVVEICITGLTAPQATMQTLTGLIEHVVGAHECETYFCFNDHIFIVLQNAPLSCVPEIYREVGLLFLGKALSWQKESAVESSLCRTYRTRETLEDLFRSVLELASIASAEAKQTPESEFTPDVRVFAHAKHFRYSRDKLCILLVEGTRFSQRLLMGILGKQYDIIVAEDGAQALKLYETNAPDIVFLEIELEKINGIQVLERMNALDREAFVIMLTANRTAQDVENAKARNAKRYIVKPFSRKRIEDAMDDFFVRFPHRAMKF